LALGFEDISDPEKYAGFHHQESDTTILLAIHPLDEPALLRDIGSVRTMLDLKGLLDSKDFDQIVAKGRIPKSLNRRATTS
jgi:hypothetical protein